MSRQFLPTTIQKTWAVIFGTYLFGNEAADKAGCLGKEGADALLASFSSNPYKSGALKTEVGWPYIDQLLHPSPCIVEQCEKHIIPLAMQRVTVDMGKETLRLCLGQISQGSSGSFLKGYREDSLTEGGNLWLPAQDIAEKRMNGGQTHIAA